MAAAGHQAEKSLQDTLDKHAGKFLCVVEGAIPTKDNGIYCKIGGRTAVDILAEVAPKAAAIIAIGSCATYGGIQAANPNPTGARGRTGSGLKGKPVINIPGCPPNPISVSRDRPPLPDLQPPARDRQPGPTSFCLWPQDS